MEHRNPKTLNPCNYYAITVAMLLPKPWIDDKRNFGTMREHSDEKTNDDAKHDMLMHAVSYTAEHDCHTKLLETGET